MALFDVIKPLFAGKPLLLVATKTDIRPLESLTPENQQLLEKVLQENPNAQLVPMSNISEEGVMDVKAIACDKLLVSRVEQKLSAKKLQPHLNRLHVAMPQQRDSKARPAFIPDSVLRRNNNNNDAMRDSDSEDDWVDESVLERDAHLPEWLRGFGSQRWRERYLLKDDDWRFDTVPEIYNGHNIADFIDPEIWEKLEMLEQAESERLQQLEDDELMDDYSDLDDEQQLELRAIRRKKGLLTQDRAMRLIRNKGRMGRSGARSDTLSNMDEHLSELGIDTSSALARLRAFSRSRSTSRQGRALSRTQSLAPKPEGLPVEKAVRSQSRSRARSVSKSSSFRDFGQEVAAAKMKFQKQKYLKNSYSRHETDVSIPDMKPRFLFKGKRGLGTSDWR